MGNEQELREILILLNQQSLRISELEKEKSDLISDLQKKDSLLSETILMAEEMKSKIEQSSLVITHGGSGSIIGASGPAVLGWMNAHFSMSAGIASLSAFALAGAAAIVVARVFFFERDKV